MAQISDDTDATRMCTVTRTVCQNCIHAHRRMQDNRGSSLAVRTQISKVLPRLLHLVCRELGRHSNGDASGKRERREHSLYVHRASLFLFVIINSKPPLSDTSEKRNAFNCSSTINLRLRSNISDRESIERSNSKDSTVSGLLSIKIFVALYFTV